MGTSGQRAAFVGAGRSIVHGNFRVGARVDSVSPIELGPRRRLLLAGPRGLRRPSGVWIVLTFQRGSRRRQLLRAHLRPLALKPSPTPAPPIAPSAADAISLVMVRMPPVAPTAPVATGAVGPQRPRVTGHRHDARGSYPLRPQQRTPRRPSALGARPKMMSQRANEPKIFELALAITRKISNSQNWQVSWVKTHSDWGFLAAGCYSALRIGGNDDSQMTVCFAPYNSPAESNN